jgi:hypothetical protein
MRLIALPFLSLQAPAGRLRLVGRAGQFVLAALLAGFIHSCGAWSQSYSDSPVLAD